MQYCALFNIMMYKNAYASKMSGAGGKEAAEEIALMGNPQPSTCSSGMHKTRLRVLHLYRRGFWAISAF